MQKAFLVWSLLVPMFGKEGADLSSSPCSQKHLVFSEQELHMTSPTKCSNITILRLIYHPQNMEMEMRSQTCKERALTKRLLWQCGWYTYLQTFPIKLEAAWWFLGAFGMRSFLVIVFGLVFFKWYIQVCLK